MSAKEPSTKKSKSARPVGSMTQWGTFGSPNGEEEDTSIPGEQQDSPPAPQEAGTPVRQDTSMPVNQQGSTMSSQSTGGPANQYDRILVGQDTGKTGSQENRRVVSQQADIPAEQQDSTPALMKATYYITPEQDMKLERIRLARRGRGRKMDKSALIREAIDLLSE